MPPSGFVADEAKALSGFSKSVLTRFAQEVSAGKHRSTAEGIAHELVVIECELAKEISHIERGTLMLVRELYIDFKSGKTLEEIEIAFGALAHKKYE